MRILLCEVTTTYTFAGDGKAHQEDGTPTESVYVQLTSIDQAGNTSNITAPINIFYDTFAPIQPGIMQLGSDDVYASGEGNSDMYLEMKSPSGIVTTTKLLKTNNLGITSNLEQGGVIDSMHLIFTDEYGDYIVKLTSYDASGNKSETTKKFTRKLNASDYVTDAMRATATQVVTQALAKLGVQQTSMQQQSNALIQQLAQALSTSHVYSAEEVDSMASNLALQIVQKVYEVNPTGIEAALAMQGAEGDTLMDRIASVIVRPAYASPVLIGEIVVASVGVGVYTFGGRDGKIFVLDVVLGVAAGVTLVKQGPQQSAMVITGTVNAAKEGSLTGFPTLTQEEADNMITSATVAALTAGSAESIGILAGRVGTFIKGSEKLSQEGVEAAVVKRTQRAGRISTSTTINNSVKSKAGSVANKSTEITNGLRAGATQAFRPLTSSYYRDNLSILTKFNGRNTTGEVTHHAHHVFVQKYSDYFARWGINIHDPRYLTWWEANSHLSKVVEYETRWDLFLAPYIQTNTKPSVELLLKKGREFMGPYGLKLNY